MGQLWGWREQVYLPSTWQTSGLGAWISRLVGSGGRRCRWTLRQQPQTVAYPAAPSGLGPGLYPGGLGFWDLPTRGYDYRSPDCRIPRSGTCSGLSGLQQVLPCSLVRKLGSKATRQERWPHLGVIQSFPAPQGLPGGPQSLQVGDLAPRRAPPQTHQTPGCLLSPSCRSAQNWPRWGSGMSCPWLPSCIYSGREAGG